MWAYILEYRCVIGIRGTGKAYTVVLCGSGRVIFVFMDGFHLGLEAGFRGGCC